MSIFNQFTKCKDSVFPDQGQCIIIDADEMEKSRSISFLKKVRIGTTTMMMTTIKKLKTKWKTKLKV